MKVACSASLLGCHFLNHSGLLDFLLREEKGMCKINVSRPLASTSRMHLCHSPSSLWRWRIFSPSIGLLENQFILRFITSFEVFCSFISITLWCRIAKKTQNIVSLRHNEENLSGPWVFVHMNLLAIPHGSAGYHHEAFYPTWFIS